MRTAVQVESRSEFPKLLQRKCVCGGTPGPSGECEECRSKRLHRKIGNAKAESGSTLVPPLVHDVLRSPGQPLDSTTRAFMESRFGHKFAGVRVHSDAEAARSARSVNATAYTVGSHVVFGAGTYAPSTREGSYLLAHELTHVIQQDRYRQGTAEEGQSLAITSKNHPSEIEANHVASAIISGVNTRVAPEQPGHEFCAITDPSQRDVGTINPRGEFRSLDSGVDILSTSPLTPRAVQPQSLARQEDGTGDIVGETASDTSPSTGSSSPPPLCPAVPTATPPTCEGRHDAYAAARRCFPLNSWLACVDRASADVCKAVHAFRFEGSQGTALRACTGLDPNGDPGMTRRKGDWFNSTNSCIWAHWRRALEAMHDTTRPIPPSLTPEWDSAVSICRTEGVGSDTCCRAQVVAEQTAIDRCGGYDSLLFGRLPTYVPYSETCSAVVALGAGGLPFTGNFESVRDRITYGFLRCCTF